MSTPEKRAWLYAIAWLGGGVAAMALAVWLVSLIRWGWPADRAEQQLAIIGNALYGAMAMSMLVTLGLSLRNAIRNIKGSTALGSFEANASDTQEVVATAQVQVTTDKGEG